MFDMYWHFYKTLMYILNSKDVSYSQVLSITCSMSLGRHALKQPAPHLTLHVTRCSLQQWPNSNPFGLCNVSRKFAPNLARVAAPASAQRKLPMRPADKVCTIYLRRDLGYMSPSRHIDVAAGTRPTARNRKVYAGC